ncbi:MAG: efflux RND transporter periplasmic adaptor subunit [Halioglobus sp.]
MFKRFRRVLAPIVVIAGGIGIYSLLHATKPEPDKSTEEPRPTSVYTALAEQSDIVLKVETQGEVRARTELDVVAQVGGRILTVSPEFVEGGTITPGVPLLKIEDTDYKLALREAEARVAETEVAVQQALADADVARKQLRNDKTASDLALKKPQVAEARARREAAMAGLEQAKLDLDRTEVSLPFAGRVVSTRVDTGQFITSGTTLGNVFGTGIVEVRLPLSNSQLASLGLPIGFTAAPGAGLPVTLSADVAGAQHSWPARLVRLDASVDPDTRMLFAIAEVADPYGANKSESGMPLAVGLFVDATIDGRQLPAAVSIPNSALRAGDKVFLVNGEGRLEMRSVQIAHVGSGRVVVSSGLTAGEEVIVSAIRNAISGMALTSINDDNEAAAKAETPTESAVDSTLDNG